MNARTFRTVNRFLHLVGAAAIGTFVYSPWGAEQSFSWATAGVVVPLLTLTGLALWKQAAVMRWLGLSARPPSPRA